MDSLPPDSLEVVFDSLATHFHSNRSCVRLAMTCRRLHSIFQSSARQLCRKKALARKLNFDLSRVDSLIARYPTEYDPELETTAVTEWSSVYECRQTHRFFVKSCKRVRIYQQSHQVGNKDGAPTMVKILKDDNDVIQTLAAYPEAHIYCNHIEIPTPLLYRSQA